MVCTPGRIRVQLSQDSYRLMWEGKGRQDGDEWERRVVVCRKCGKAMQNRSLRQHLAGVHDIYESEVLEEHCLDWQAGVEYKAVQGKWRRGGKGKIACPVPDFPGELGTPWMLQRHFRDIHFGDTVYIRWEGGPYPRCVQCNMQCNPAYSKHIQMKTCQVGRERREQREKAIDAALALCRSTSTGMCWERCWSSEARRSPSQPARPS